jgi:hypothetical protein
MPSARINRFLPYVIFIDAVAHRVVTTDRCTAQLPAEGGGFYVDSESMPFRPVGRHYLSHDAMNHLLMGGGVFTQGHMYRLEHNPADAKGYMAPSDPQPAQPAAPAASFWQRLTTTLRAVFG